MQRVLIQSENHQHDRHRDKHDKPVQRIDKKKFERPLFPQHDAEHRRHDKSEPGPYTELYRADDVKYSPCHSEVIHDVRRKHTRKNSDNDCWYHPPLALFCHLWRYANHAHPRPPEYSRVVPPKANNHRNDTGYQYWNERYFIHINNGNARFVFVQILLCTRILSLLYLFYEIVFSQA